MARVDHRGRRARRRESRSEAVEQREHHRPAVGHEAASPRASTRRALTQSRGGSRRPRRRRTGTGRRARPGSSVRSGATSASTYRPATDRLAARRRRSRAPRRARGRSLPRTSHRPSRTPPTQMSHRPGQMSLPVAAPVDEEPAVRSEHRDPDRAVAEVQRRAFASASRPSITRSCSSTTSTSSSRPSWGPVAGPVPRSQEKTYHAAMTVETLREEAHDLLDERCAAPPAARVAGARQRPAGHPRARARVARGPAARHHPARDRRAASWRCSTGRQARARRSSCAATWTRCRCPRTPASTSPRAVDGMHARLRSRHAHRDALRRGPAAERPPRRLAGRVLFMFQPGEEGHHGARFMLDEGLLDVPPLADGRRRRSTRRSPCTSRRRSRRAG